MEEARRRAKTVLPDTKSGEILFQVSFALAIAGDTTDAGIVAEKLAASHPVTSAIDVSKSIFQGALDR